MKLIVLCLLVVAPWVVRSDTTCEQAFKCIDDQLNEMINGQIGVELTGHYTYLYLSQIFEQHTRHYPKVAKYFRAKAAEELFNAERFIEYQNQRGGIVEIESVSRYVRGACSNVQTVTQAFKCAMHLEAYVTRQLTYLYNDASEVVGGRSDCTDVFDDDDLKLTQPMLLKCRSENAVETTSSCASCIGNLESVAYVQLAEIIARKFLGRQVEDTKEIANHYRNLKKLEKANGALGYYLFEKNLEL